MRRAPPGPRRTRGPQAPPTRPSLPRRTPASRGTPSCTRGWPPRSRAGTPVGAQQPQRVAAADLLAAGDQVDRIVDVEVGDHPPPDLRPLGRLLEVLGVDLGALLPLLRELVLGEAGVDRAGLD